eukprot:364647-Chlamydomonas_euryale.AAC.13
MWEPSPRGRYFIAPAHKRSDVSSAGLGTPSHHAPPCASQHVRAPPLPQPVLHPASPQAPFAALPAARLPLPSSRHRGSQPLCALLPTHPPVCSLLPPCLPHTLLTPPSASSLAIRKISSAVSSRDAGVRSTPSAGIQYVQRRLQRSVRLIRR